ncbi:hypothetical protein J5868_02100, partial [Candidatus Saccharibacteria bacterium]|nr:hypothetical protein [Candidatus Saccharibacteria bacterium]
MFGTETGDYTGGTGDEHTGSSSGCDPNTDPNCHSISHYCVTDAARFRARCTGYSWMFFKYVGGIDNYQYTDIVYALPYRESLTTVQWATVPKQDTSSKNSFKTCMNPAYENAGFWHFGQNTFTDDNSAKTYGRGAHNNQVISEGGVARGGLVYAYSFNPGAGVSYKNTKYNYYNFGHITSRNYSNNLTPRIYNGEQYANKRGSGANDLNAFNASIFQQSINLLNQGWNADGLINRGFRSGIDRGQQLWKKVNGVWRLMYVAVGTKSPKDVFDEFKEAFKIAEDRDYDQGDDLPNWYYFCSWNAKAWDLELIPVDEETKEILSSKVSWSGGPVWLDKAQDNTTASVTRGTNNQYAFLGFKFATSVNDLPNVDYYADEDENIYLSGTSNPRETINVKSIKGDMTVYAVYKKVSLTAKAVDEKGNSLSSIIGDVSATGVAADNSTSVTRRKDDRYIFLGFKKVDSCKGANSCSEIVNSDWVPKDGSNYYVSGGKETEFDERDITFNVRNLTDKEVVYAVYEEKSSFLGQILVNGNVVVSPNTIDRYTDKSEKQTINIENCSPVTGCDVTFTHNMKRKSGNKKVDYVISRTSNYWNNGLGVEPKILKTKNEEDFNDVGNGNIKQLYNDTGLKLYPGQVVCEKLSFKPFVWKNDEIVLEACASALGNAQPDDPVTPGNPDTPWDDPDDDDDNLSGAAAFLKLEVKNENVSKYNTYRRIIYAKPSDKVKFRATYNPILQYTAYLMPQQMKIDSGSAIFPSTGTNTKSFMKDLFNANKGSSLKNWNNAFYVNGISGIFKDKCSDNGNECIFNVGDSAKKTKESSSFTIQTNHVGQELKETAITNKSDKVKTTPSQVSFVSNGAAKINLGNVITSDKVSDAMVRVPYNYDNEICVRKNAAQGTECMDSSESLGTFGAGERVRGAYQISVKPKINEKIDKNKGYATIVPEAKSKIIIYKGSPDVGGDVSGDDICRARYGMVEDGVSCWYSDEKTYSGSNSLNAEGNLEKGATKIPEFILNIPDVDAGTSYCIAAAVYPASSIEASDANYATNSMAWADKEGNHMWRVSRSVCFTVGKKPTFQVWGGSFYGANDIKVSSTVKNNLTLPSGNVKVDGGVIVFSSWVEQTVVAKGKVEN